MKYIQVTMTENEAKSFVSLIEEVGVKKAFMHELIRLEPIAFQIAEELKK